MEKKWMVQGWLYKLQVIKEKNLDRDLKTVNAGHKKKMFVTTAKNLVIGIFNLKLFKILLR
jgi:hypothetical protein